jgi:hypothetical protein
MKTQFGNFFKLPLTVIRVFPATTTVVSGTLPVQCYAYASLTDQYRNLQNGYSCCNGPYDYGVTLPSVGIVFQDQRVHSLSLLLFLTRVHVEPVILAISMEH